MRFFFIKRVGAEVYLAVICMHFMTCNVNTNTRIHLNTLPATQICV